MDAYSQDLRDRVLRVGAWGSSDGHCEPFEVSRVWVYQVRNRLKQTGQRSSLQIGGHGGPVGGMEPTLGPG